MECLFNCKVLKKIYIIAGEEFGSEAGSIMIVKMSLYRFMTSGEAIRDTLAQDLYDMNYRPLREDTIVCMRPAIKGGDF